jgi:hypothetical protein
MNGRQLLAAITAESAIREAAMTDRAGAEIGRALFEQAKVEKTSLSTPCSSVDPGRPLPAKIHRLRPCFNAAAGTVRAWPGGPSACGPRTGGRWQLIAEITEIDAACL